MAFEDELLDEMADAYSEQLEENDTECPYDDCSATVFDVEIWVNCSGVKPRSFFPWIGRTHPAHHRSDGLYRCGGSRSGRPQAPMPAVATPISALAGVC